MSCPYFDHPKVHKHDHTSKENQRFKCPQCGKTFTETIGTIYYRRQISKEEIETILQTHAEGTSLRAVARVSHRVYGTVVSLLQATSEKSQLVHNQAIQSVETHAIIADEMWLFGTPTIGEVTSGFYPLRLPM